MSLRALYVLIWQAFIKSSYELKRSQRHLLVAIENNRIEGRINGDK